MLRPRRALLAVAGLSTAGLVTVGAVGVAHSADSVDPPAQSAVDKPAHAATVAALHRLTRPDAIASLHRRARAHDLRRLRHVDGIRTVAVVDTGRLTLRRRHLTVLGVSPSHLRSFTPDLTARSDALWQSIAHGDLTVGYAQSHGLRRLLGRDLAVTGRHHATVAMRLGAFASIGVGSAQALVPHSQAHALGLLPAHRLVISAPHLSTADLAVAVRRTVAKHAVVHDVRPHVTVQPFSAFARATIPAPYLTLYRTAATTCPGLPWTVLAGIGAVETGHGANVHRSVKGAVGPMQFLPSTFAAYGVDGDGDGAADIMNPADAIFSAARYLCLWGASRGGQALYDAIWAYNHADWYVRLVINYANAYA